jgi:uncharacterized protein YggE
MCLSIFPSKHHKLLDVAISVTYSNTREFNMPSRNQFQRLFSLLMLGLACSGNPAHGQSASPVATIHASGQHELKLEPQKLRLTLTIRAEGADAKSAIEALLEHKTRVKSELLAMKAEAGSIDFGAAQLSSGIPGMSAEMAPYGARMMAQLGGASNIDPAEVPKVYTAVSRVRAEWSLPTADADALAMLPETLRQQVKERDLMGEKNKADLDGPQQEKLEEMQAAMQENMGYFTSAGEISPVTVMFVAKIDEKARKAAISAAYERAFAQAKMLASVSGKSLGNLQSLRTADVPVPATEGIESIYGAAYAAYTNYAASQTMTSSVAIDEAENASPQGLKVFVRVEAEFALAD